MFCCFSCIYIWSCCTLKIQLMLNYLRLSEESETLMAMFWYLSMPIKTNCTVGALGGASCRCPPVPVQMCLCGGAWGAATFHCSLSQGGWTPACPWMWEMKWGCCKGALGKVLCMAGYWEKCCCSGTPPLVGLWQWSPINNSSTLPVRQLKVQRSFLKLALGKNSKSGLL